MKEPHAGRKGKFTRGQGINRSPVPTEIHDVTPLHQVNRADADQSAGSEVRGLKRHISDRGNSPSACAESDVGRKRLKLDGEWDNTRDKPEEAAIMGLRRVLGPGANFRSKEQRDCLVRVVQTKSSPRALLIILPTGAGKSLLFLAPCSLPQARVTVVIVPYVALKEDLIAKAKAARLHYAIFTPSLQEAVPLVFASAEHLLDKGGLLHYLRLMSERGQLHRIVVDECHVVLTDMGYRALALQRYKRLVDFDCQLLLLTATLPPMEESEFLNIMSLGLTPEQPQEQQCEIMRYPTCRSNLKFRVLGIPRARRRGQMMPEKREILGPPLMDLLREGAILGPGERGIIFCPFIDDLEAYHHMTLQYDVFPEQPPMYHGRMGAPLRSQALEKWLDVGGWILATKGLGVGVDFPKLRIVIHMGYGREDTLMEYSQQVGRAARDGSRGYCYFLYVHEDSALDSLSTTPTCGSDALKHFLYTTRCRRGVLSAYLDGAHSVCGVGDAPCDVCEEDGQWEATPMQMNPDQHKTISQMQRDRGFEPHANLMTITQMFQASGTPDPISSFALTPLESRAALDVTHRFDSPEGDTLHSSGSIDYGDSMDDMDIPGSLLQRARDSPVVIGSSMEAKTPIPRRRSSADEHQDCPTPPIANGRVTHRVVDQAVVSTQWARMRLALSQAQGKCVGCYVFPLRPYDHPMSDCAHGLQVEKYLGVLRKKLHCPRDSCCFRCLLPKTECNARFTRSRCKNPENTVLAIALAIHLFQPAASRFFRPGGYPLAVKDGLSPQDDHAIGIFATWVAMVGEWGGQPAINALRVVGFAVEQLKVVR